MPTESKRIKSYASLIAILLACLLVAYYVGSRIKNKTDMANILGIAGLNGAKVYILEATPSLLSELESTNSNPRKAIEPLTRALSAKVAEHVKLKRQYSDPKSVAAMQEFEVSYAYALRILILKQWKPGMSKKEIANIYFMENKNITSQYDFKNHAEDFLGFK